jgi:RNA polymerase sigma-70 factor (ECF subfamily)
LFLLEAISNGSWYSFLIHPTNKTLFANTTGDCRWYSLQFKNHLSIATQRNFTHSANVKSSSVRLKFTKPTNFFSTYFVSAKYMKVEGRLLLERPSRTPDMALALETQLPGNLLARNQTSLALLIERAAVGDAAAFEEIMIRSQRRVMAMSWRMLGNEADARDACQEVFLRVYKHLDRFKQDQDFFPWLYRITVNVCRDALKERRRQDRQFTSLADETNEVAREIPAHEANAEQLLMQAQRREVIARAIAMLPFKERASIVLRDVEGLSTEEVARVLKSSSTTVRSQISVARKKIRKYCVRHLAEHF